MSSSKILFQVTGSIAAFKACSVISQLGQEGHEVQVVVTPQALKFVGAATFEGLTGRSVLYHTFQPGQQMKHISLIQWCDLAILAPATASTINKMVAGIGDNLVTNLFLAFDFSKPYLIFPAMNPRMLTHPTTAASLAKLKCWGVEVMPSQIGPLACGEMGAGRLLEPTEMLSRIASFLKGARTEKEDKSRLRVLITGGGTREAIDGVRFIGNNSTGATGAQIADYFQAMGDEVTYLAGVGAKRPLQVANVGSFTDCSDLDHHLAKELAAKKFDAIIHLAAVGDYRVGSIEIDHEKKVATSSVKLGSDSEDLKINLKKNKKILPHLKAYSKNKDLVVVGFKLTHNAKTGEARQLVQKLFNQGGVDYVVHNEWTQIQEDQHPAVIYGLNHEEHLIKNKSELSSCLRSIILSRNPKRNTNGELHCDSMS